MSSIEELKNISQPKVVQQISIQDKLVDFGRIDQPACYGDCEIVFEVQTLEEDDKFVHIKGQVGFLMPYQTIEVLKNNPNLEVEFMDDVDFYLKYEKATHRMIVGRYCRKVICEPDEYAKWKHTWEYDDPQQDTPDHFPYFRLMRSKDHALIPHLVKSLWKDSNTPRIYIPTKEWRLM
jgi:hypothetical protein